MRAPMQVFAITLFLGFAIAPRALAEEPGGPDHLAPLVRLLGGEWMASGALVSDTEATALDIVVAYEWGVNQKIVKSESFVVRDGERRLEFETTMGWHPRDKTLVFFSFSAEGAMFDGTIQPQDDGLEFRWEAFEGTSATSYRQILRFTGPDEYRSSLLKRAGGSWERLSEATFRRRSAA